ncbi:hypothetical protein ACHQM5_025186 [Ranunculus cassubicifolius]
MASNIKFFTTLCILSSIFLASEARPFNVLSTTDCSKGIDSFFGVFNGLSIMGIKNSGPSPGGEGHNNVEAQTLGGIKNSGPSPGGGHKFVNGQTLGGIKVSGPSPGGKGHSFTLGGIKQSSGARITSIDIQMIGGIKEGPSPGGKGHSFTNAGTLGGIKEALRTHRHGNGHDLLDIQMIGGIKDGPSPGVGHSFITGGIH